MTKRVRRTGSERRGLATWMRVAGLLVLGVPLLVMLYLVFQLLALLVLGLFTGSGG